MSLTDLAPVSWIDFEHDQAQRHLERCRIGHAALLAFIDVEFRRLEFVADEFEHRLAGEVGDREHRLENRLQALIDPPAGGFLDLQKLVVGFLLHLDEVRHLGDFGDLAEKLADASCDLRPCVPQPCDFLRKSDFSKPIQTACLQALFRNFKKAVVQTQCYESRPACTLRGSRIVTASITSARPWRRPPRASSSSLRRPSC